MAAEVAELYRLDSSDQGTFGRLFAGPLRLYSLELPWRDNMPNISCIPPATYTATFTFSPHFGRLLYLVGAVPGRSGIRVHPANLAGDKSKGFRCQLNGCIALGERLGWLDGQKAVLNSASAVRRVEEYYKGEPFQLKITEGLWNS